jgi:hypothetical protein
MVATLNTIHSTPMRSGQNCKRLFTFFIELVLVPALLDQVRPLMSNCRETIAVLATLVPPNQFWRWKDMWSNSLRTAIFVAALLEYLTNGSMISISKVEELLGS